MILGTFYGRHSPSGQKLTAAPYPCSPGAFFAADRPAYAANVPLVRVSALSVLAPPLAAAEGVAACGRSEDKPGEIEPSEIELGPDE